MLTFNFFDSNEWEVVTNEALKDKIKALEKERDFNDAVLDAMQNKIETLKADNDKLKTLNENMESVLKNNTDYNSGLEEKIKNLRKSVELRDKVIDELNTKNAKLLKSANLYNSTISLGSEYITKIENQRKQLYHLEKKIESQRKVISEQETIISEKNSQLVNANRKIDELIEGIRTPEDKAWKDKYNALVISANEVAKECEMYRNIALRNKKENHDKKEALEKIDDIIKENGYRKG